MHSVYNRIGPYDIKQEIGRGGMAVVFLATDTPTNRHAAPRPLAHYSGPYVLGAVGPFDPEDLEAFVA